jgi:hypothetical protein
VGRELLMQMYSNFVYQKDYDRLSLAKYEGFRLWEKTEMDLRLDFLKEYTRRIETTHLLSTTHFVERMKERGNTLASTEYSDIFFRKALKKMYENGLFYTEKDDVEPLNSHQKVVWKKKYGIK